MDSHYIATSSIHSERFGCAVAKAYTGKIEEIPAIYKYCTDNSIKLILLKVAGNATDVVQHLEDKGARLMETLMYYSRDISKTPVSEGIFSHEINWLVAGEEEKIAAISKESFAGYADQYNANKRLSRADVGAIHADWAYRSCIDKNVADAVFVARDGKEPCGFITIKTSDDTCELVLSGILNAYQRKGVYQDLIAYCMQYASDNNFRYVRAATNIHNYGVQKVWVRQRMEPQQSFYLLHHWLDDGKT